MSKLFILVSRPSERLEPPRYCTNVSVSTACKQDAFAPSAQTVCTVQPQALVPPKRSSFRRVAALGPPTCPFIRTLMALIAPSVDGDEALPMHSLPDVRHRVPVLRSHPGSEDKHPQTLQVLGNILDVWCILVANGAGNSARQTCGKSRPEEQSTRVSFCSYFLAHQNRLFTPRAALL